MGRDAPETLLFGVVVRPKRHFSEPWATEKDPWGVYARTPRAKGSILVRAAMRGGWMGARDGARRAPKEPKGALRGPKMIENGAQERPKRRKRINMYET